MEGWFLSLKIDSVISFSTLCGKYGVSMGISIHSIAILPTVRTPIESARWSHSFGGGFLQGLIILNPASFAKRISFTIISFESGYDSFTGYNPSKKAAFKYKGLSLR